MRALTKTKDWNDSSRWGAMFVYCLPFLIDDFYILERQSRWHCLRRCNASDKVWIAVESFVYIWIGFGISFWSQYQSIFVYKNQTLRDFTNFLHFRASSRHKTSFQLLTQKMFRDNSFKAIMCAARFSTLANIRSSILECEALVNATITDHSSDLSHKINFRNFISKLPVLGAVDGNCVKLEIIKFKIKIAKTESESVNRAPFV